MSASASLAACRQRWRAWRRCCSAACWRFTRRWPARSSFASPRPATGLAPCSSPPCGLLTEWLRGWVFTGFPWLAAGYSQAPPSPLAGYAPLLGVYGVSLASALLGALIFEIVRRWLSTVEICPARGWLRWCPALPLLLAAAAILAAGALLREVPLDDAGGRRAAVGRPAAGQRGAGNEMAARAFRRFTAQLLPPGTGESGATHGSARNRPARFPRPDSRGLSRRPAATRAAPARRHCCSASPVGDRRALLQCGAEPRPVSAGSATTRSHLVPFGEFVPPGFRLVHGDGQHPDVRLHAGANHRRRCASPASRSR